MLPREFRSLLFTVVQQIINGQSEYKYDYEEFHDQSDLKQFRFKSTKGDKTGKICLTFPVDIEVSDVKVLEGRIDAILAAEGPAKWTAEWIVPVRWSCRMDSEAVLGSHMSSVGVLYLAWDQKKGQQAIWLGATTPEILGAVKTLLEVRGIALVHNSYSYQLSDNALSTKRLPETQAGFLADLETQVARVEAEIKVGEHTSPRHFSKALGFYLAGKHCVVLSGHVNPSELPVHSVTSALSTYARSFSSTELNFEDDRIILGFTEDEMAYIKSNTRSCTLQSNLRNLFEQPDENFENFKKLALAVCQDAFFAVCHILMANKEFVQQYQANFKDLKIFEEHLPFFNEWVSKIVYKLFYVFLNDLNIPDSLTFEKQAVIKNNLSNIVEKLNEVSLVRLRFQNVYKQLLRCIYQSQENVGALGNIANFLCLFFQKDSPSDVSLEGLLAFLDICFFEWNDRLEDLIPTSGSTAFLDTTVLKFIVQIRTLESRSYPAVIFVSEFLGRLSPELSGVTKTLEELSESVSNEPLREKASVWRREYKDTISNPVIHSDPLLSTALIIQQNFSAGGDFSLAAEQRDPNASFTVIEDDPVLGLSAIREDGECSAEVFSTPIPVAEVIDTKRAEDGNSFQSLASAADQEQEAEPAALITAVAAASELILATGTPPPASSVTDVEASSGGDDAQQVAESIAPVSVTIAVEPLPQPPEISTVAAKTSPVDVDKPAVEPSIPWYRVALGVMGLGLLGLAIAAVIIASHGAGAAPVAAAMPWLAHGVVYPLMAYAGVEASVAVTGVAVAAGVSLSVAAVPPAPRHRLLDRVKAWFGHRGGESKLAAPTLIRGGSSAQILGVQGTKSDGVVSVPAGSARYGSLQQTAGATGPGVSTAAVRAPSPVMG